MFQILSSQNLATYGKTYGQLIGNIMSSIVQEVEQYGLVIRWIMVKACPQSQYVSSSEIRPHFSWFSLDRPTPTLRLLNILHTGHSKLFSARWCSVGTIHFLVFWSKESFYLSILPWSWFIFNICVHLSKFFLYFRQAIRRLIPKIVCKLSCYCFVLSQSALTPRRTILNY